MVNGRVRQIIEEMGLTREEFAHLIGMTTSTVERWVNNKSKPSKVARMLIRKHFAEYTERKKEYAGKYDPLGN